MGSWLFAFTLTTKKDLDVHDTLCDTEGGIIGRILRKSPPYRGDCFTYDVESTKEIYEKLERGEIKIYGIEKYDVSSCSTAYTKN